MDSSGSVSTLSVSVPVVVLSAVVPTLIAQQWLEPELEDTDLDDTVVKKI